MYLIPAPGKYIQGYDAFDTMGEQAKLFGKNYFCLSDPIFEDERFTFLRAKRDGIKKSFNDNGVDITFETFKGEVTKKEIARISEAVAAGGYDAVLALGGGKVQDTSKPAAMGANLPLIIAPTMIAVNAPCSSATVIYDENHEVDDIYYAPTGPNLVVVDTHVIIEAPRFSIIAGMGDALPTFFEGRVNSENNTNTIYGAKVSYLGDKLRELCYESLLENGELALKAYDAKVVDPYFERIIQTNTWLSCIAFETTGLSTAHAIEDALNLIPEAQKVLHGYRVAYGTLCLCLIQDRGIEEFEELQDFCARVGLPITLEDMYIVEDVEEKIRNIVPACLEDFDGCYNKPPQANADSIYNAIMMVDALGKEYYAKNGK